MATDLKNKVVLITGASTGIGAAAARAFAEQGSKVVVHYNASKEAAEKVAREVKSAGGEALLVGGDVTKSANIKRIVAETLAGFGRIDVLVNNAGGLVQRTKIEDYSEDFLHQVLDLNVIQVAMFMHEVVPTMRKQGGGNIINVSSVAARTGGGGGSAIYAGAKAFISTFSRSIAKELAAERIRVNVVSPGVITTDMQDRVTSREQLKAVTAQIPMGRIGAPDDCVGTFLYLCSDRLSGYVTGQVVEVNGGLLMP